MAESFMLDLQNDTEELLGFNPEADANALLPPVPAGDYHVKFRFTNPNEDYTDEKTGEVLNKRWATKLWGQKSPQKVLVTSLTAEIYNSEGGMYDGRQVRDGLVSTMIRQATGTCPMQGVIQCITGQFPPTCKSRKQFFELLDSIIGEDGAATGVVTLDWEASENLKEEEREALKAEGKKPFRVRGMKNFPKAKDADGKEIPGVFVPEVSHNGETYRAYNIIARYITASADNLQPTSVGEPVIPQQAQQAPMPPAARAPQTRPATAPPQGPPVPPRAAQSRTAPPRAAAGTTAPRAPQAPPRT